MKIFISQPMNGRSNEAIEAERRDAIERAEKAMGQPVEEVKSFFKGEPGTPLGMLGRSLELMSEADVVVFCPGWSKARGCRIEHDCALQYDMTILELWPQDDPV